MRASCREGKQQAKQEALKDEGRARTVDTAGEGHAGSRILGLFGQNNC